VAFCAINGLALAARAVLDAGAKRVLIIDTDAHCGGGTYSLVCGWPEVTHLDVAVSEFDSYEPERNTPSTLDIVTDASAYLPTLHSRLSALDGDPFDLVLLGVGVDCHQGNGGPRGVTYQLLAEREAMIFSWAAARAVPVAFCLLDGYKSPELSEEAVARLHRLAIAAAEVSEKCGRWRVRRPEVRSPRRGLEVTTKATGTLEQEQSSWCRLRPSWEAKSEMSGYR
jgi:acetoin utilization deacetylase AcuC-like enzyme